MSQMQQLKAAIGCHVTRHLFSVSKVSSFSGHFYQYSDVHSHFCHILPAKKIDRAQAAQRLCAGKEVCFVGLDLPGKNLGVPRVFGTPKNM